MVDPAQILVDEIATDPAGLYGGLSTNRQFYDRLVEPGLRNHWVTLTSAQIFEAIDATEFVALTDASQRRVDRILSLGGQIATAPGAKARDEMIAIFGAGSTTISNLATIANPKRSRAAELGIAGWITLGRVSAARSSG